MHQITRTLAFVIAASLSVLGAVATYYVTRPPVVEGYDLVGTEFYPSFQDPTAATAIRVAAWNDRSNRIEQFEVRYENGQWRIPSHYNYPADGREQLARAAASAVGIVRGSKVSASSDTHERMGVIDPDDKSTIQGQGATGTRITLYNGEEVLADFIIGNPREPGDDDTSLEDDETTGRQEKQGIYYVRMPGKEDVYLAEVKIDVSTRFADWIEKNLLDLTSGDLREIVLDRYSVDEATGTVQTGVRSDLTRKSASDPWELADLDPAKEKLKPGVVNAMARALDDLRIVGVRPKPQGLSAQLRQIEGANLTQQVVMDLQSKGFFLARSGELLSNEGEVHAGTAEGVMYVLRFGEVFTGGDLEIEVGQSSTDEADMPADEEKTDDEESEPKRSSTTQSSRFVFVTAQLNPELLGEAPVEPVKPEPPATPKPDDAKPEDAKPEDAPAADTEAPKAEEAPQADAPKADSAAGDATETDDCQDDTPPAEAEKQDESVEPVPQPKTPQQKYEEALKDYETKLEAYTAQKDEYDRRLEEAMTRVAELNNRFADWYYVIPADIFDDLRVPREQLVEPLEPAQEDAAAPEAPANDEAAATPMAPMPPMTSTPPADSSETPPATPAQSPAADAAPEAEPAAEAPKAEPVAEKASDDKPSDNDEAPKSDEGADRPE